MIDIDIKIFIQVCARCLLNIFGVIMYLRVGFIVAESGIYEAVAIIVIASAVTLITTLSMSALCTNGVVLGGGAYVCMHCILLSTPYVFT